MSTSVAQRQAAQRLQNINLMLSARPDLAHELLPQAQECILAINDPRRGVSQHENHAPLEGNFIQPIIAPDCYLVVPNIPAVAADTESQPRVLEFKSGPGLIIGMRGTVLDQTVGAEAAGRLEMASIGVQATWNQGRYNIITNGEDPDFIRYSDLFADGVQWTPFLRFARSCDAITFKWQNVRNVGGPDLEPTLSLAFMLMPSLGAA